MLNNLTDEELDYVLHEPISIALQEDYTVIKIADGVYSGLDEDNLGELYVSDSPFHDSLPPTEDVQWLEEWRKAVADYGVCDIPGQIIEAYPHILTDPRRFVINVYTVRKKDQYPSQGWRWEKHGPYVGVLEQTTDYLYDEEEIEQVLVFAVYHIKDVESETYPDVTEVRQLTEEQKRIADEINGQL